MENDYYLKKKRLFNIFVYGKQPKYSCDLKNSNGRQPYCFMEDDLIFFSNIKQPQFFCKWKTTLILSNEN